MRTFAIRTLAMVALAIVAVAGSAAAASSPILNALEVRRLVASAEPGDNARLSAHFVALGEHYAVEARRHTSMSQGFGGNPNRHQATDVGAHCKRLAGLNTRSAATVRELAAHHQKLSVETLTAPATASKPGC